MNKNSKIGLIISFILLMCICGLFYAFHLFTVMNVNAKKIIEKTEIIRENGTFALVNLKKISSDSKIGKTLEVQLADSNNKARKEILDLESKIKDMEKNKSTDIDSRKIEDTQIMLYDVVRTKKMQIENAYKSAIGKLETIIREKINNIVQHKKISVVFDADVIIFSDVKCVDITNNVIDCLDKENHQISIDIDSH